MCENAGDPRIFVLERPHEYWSYQSLNLSVVERAETCKKESLHELLQWMMDNDCNCGAFKYGCSSNNSLEYNDDSINKKLGTFLAELCASKRNVAMNLIIVNYKDINWSIWCDGEANMGHISILICRCNFVPI